MSFELTKKWYAESAPQNAKEAKATLTFTGVPVAAEVVVIGDETYELVAAAEDVADPANTPVILGATFTADNAVTKLAEAISANSAIVDAVGNITADTVLVIYDSIGTEGNNIGISTTCTNASWGVDVTNLSGGQYGTPCPVPFTIVKDDTYYYTNIEPNTDRDANWRRFQLVTY
jgi:hypothetical protein